MKQKLPLTLGIIVLVMMGLATIPAKGGNPNVAGPYYAIPSWDQTLPVSTRFIVLSNMGSEAVLDKETGLVWERSPNTSTYSWLSAELRCNQLTLGNRMGYRLPTVQELASLVDPSVTSGPKLPAGHPFQGVQPSLYWSVTTNANDSSYAWYVDFGSGDVITWPKNFNIYFWCVRGGQGVDPQ